MTTTSHWIEESDLREGAFLLLTSASVSRYAQMSKSLANTSALKDHFLSGLVSLQQLTARARHLRHQLACKTQRDTEEVELAIILAIIAEAAAQSVSSLLIEFSLYDNGPLTWPSALSRKLYQERANNIVDSPRASNVTACADRILSGSGIRGRPNPSTIQNTINVHREGDYLFVFRSNLSDEADQQHRHAYA